MKNKRIGVFALLALGSLCSVTALSSCAGESGSESVSSSENSSSSSSSIDESRYAFWNDEQRSLMNTYCGGPLPYDATYLSANVKVSEKEEPGTTTTYLEIIDESSSFSIKEYHKLLATYGWNIISAYGSGVVQTSSEGIEFVECTKKDSSKSVGYDMIYSYVSASKDEDGNDVSGYNLIECYVSLRSEASSATAWSKDESTNILNTIGVKLPYIALGRGYSITQYTYHYPFDPTVIEMADSYVVDLTKTYCDMLLKEGFSFKKTESYISNQYCLGKKLADGSTIGVSLYYYGGNVFDFFYTPKETIVNAWPSDIANKIKDKSGIELPVFAVKEGGSYNVYNKGNTYCIYTLDYSDTFDYIEYAENQINFVGFGWDETASFASSILTDSDQNPVGFALRVTITEPSSTFVDAYPNDKVNETVTGLLGISGIAIPAFPNEDIPALGKKVKYEVMGQETYDAYYEYYYDIVLEYKDAFVDKIGKDPSEEDIKNLAASMAYKEEGISISIFDQDQKAYLAYEETLYQAGWYGGRDGYNNIVYEDPNGKLAITLEEPEVAPTHDNCGETTIVIHPGSGKTHTNEMYFTKKEVQVAVGDYVDLNLVLNMLPYTPTYESNDTTGKITVDQNGRVYAASDTLNGAEATITATITLPSGEKRSASCVITAVKAYTPSAIIDDIASIIVSKGYTPTVTHKVTKYGWTEDYLNLAFPLGTSVDTIKKFVTDNLILEGFEPRESEEWSKWEKEAINVYPQEKLYEGCYLAYEWEDVYQVGILYEIYQKNGALYLQVFAI